MMNLIKRPFHHFFFTLNIKLNFRLFKGSAVQGRKVNGLGQKTRFLGSHTVQMSPNKPKESAETNVEQQPIDYDYFVNDFSKLRQPSVIRELSKWASERTWKRGTSRTSVTFHFSYCR